ncbi:4-hydroxyphenylpyruvate dioxygenase [Leptolyngbya sp. Heron Island J]|uniref:4-hydroxyphenylpyruvate dioxygenase family protein n=1 Tax=Leptolyngbya sp. Heron Island J TaxID=1385935 RepID=UPI0003B98A1D|nr:VOC family protein [Leptolyngbya sp. Heron Island J]ESA32373.1 4-hydroxyphenylpyruvate dioxygenase [Leptolyngbya sp. Heron Island J]
MKIDHIHFFVEDATCQRDWLVQHLGWTWVKQINCSDRTVEVLRYRDTVFVVSSPLTANSPVAEYLRQHPPGVADVAIEVPNLAATLHHLDTPPKPQKTISPLLSKLVSASQQQEPSAWARIKGWGGLQHTLIERQPLAKSAPTSVCPCVSKGIDHIVLNVPTGELEAAVKFYQCLFKLEKQQSFNIQTIQSGLRSQVLFAPASQLYFNINEPTSASSQIQTFLDANRGAGIQHIALQSEPIVPTVRTLRQRGLPLLSVPLAYYDQLQQRLQLGAIAPVQHQEWQQIVEQQILIDWQPKQPESLLLQIFSHPIFQGNHFFFEFIERRQAVQGFGEGNFLALYKAIEAAENSQQQYASAASPEGGN